MVRKLGGPDDNFISYRTSIYKLHYFETPTNLKFVMLTDTRMINLRHVLNQIYINLYVEFGEFVFSPLALEYVRDWGSNSPRVVVKNPLSPVEHPGGVGVNCEMFEAGLDQFVVSGVTCDLPSRLRTLTAGYRRETCHKTFHASVALPAFNMVHTSGVYCTSMSRSSGILLAVVEIVNYSSQEP